MFPIHARHPLSSSGPPHASHSRLFNVRWIVKLYFFWPFKRNLHAGPSKADVGPTPPVISWLARLQTVHSIIKTELSVKRTYSYWTDLSGRTFIPESTMDLVPLSPEGHFRYPWNNLTLSWTLYTMLNTIITIMF